MKAMVLKPTKKKQMDMYISMYSLTNIFAPCTTCSSLLVKPMVKSKTYLLSAGLLVC